MRLSTNTIFERSVAALQQQQYSLFKTQEQISTGKRILTPADDPAGAAQSVVTAEGISRQTQYTVNRQAGTNALQRIEGALRNVTELFQSLKETALRSGNASLSNSERAAIAKEVRARTGELLAQANSTDEAGRYLFAGFQSQTRPFAESASGVQYYGDQGQRAIQISDSRQAAVSFAGNELFERVRTGNGVFVSAASPANTGSGIATLGTVIDPASLTGNNYQITFSVSAGVTTYSVVDTTNAATLSSGNPYVSGQAISFAGMQFAVQGAPANGDSFSLTPSGNLSIFQSLRDLALALETPAFSAADLARLRNTLNAALPHLDRALENVLATRAQTGSHLREIEMLQGAGEETLIQYERTLSELQDLDYAKAVSDLTRQQATLEAVQKTFARTNQLSLFEFI